MNKNEFVAAIAEKSGLTKKDAETALSFCTYGIVGLLLEYCEKKDVDRAQLARQMYRLLTGRVAAKHGA